MKICCKAFEKIAPEFIWMGYTNDDGVKILLMPHIIGVDDQKYRVNNCPSCGENVREIEMTEKQMFDLTIDFV